MKYIISIASVLISVGCTDGREGYICFDLRSGARLEATAQMDRLSGKLEGYKVVDANGLAVSITAENSQSFDCMAPKKARAMDAAAEKAIAKLTREAAELDKEAERLKARKDAERTARQAAESRAAN
jgi:hypothetical protein